MSVVDSGDRQMAGFRDYAQFSAPTRVLAGRGLLESDAVGYEFAKEGAKRVLLVTDEGVREAGPADLALASARDGGVDVVGIFDDVLVDSDVAAVERLAEAIAEHEADAMIAVGGGSVLDTAKAANVLATHGGNPREWEGFFALPRDAQTGKPEPLRPLACIPTTAGTGSESSLIAHLRDREARFTFPIADFPLYPTLAILDPEATETMPRELAAATGMDAMSHAIEGFVSREWTYHGDAYALQALRLLRHNFVLAVEEPDEAVRGGMLLAANLAAMPSASGAAGIAHAMAHPCSAHCDVPHGVANAIILPAVVHWNAEGGDDIANRYRIVARELGMEVSNSIEGVADELRDHLQDLARRVGLPSRLSEVSVDEDTIADLAADALADSSTLANAREPSRQDFEQLYREVL
ncbi:MAG: iron-containing alcohol dehydrogenase family protein [Solirubrobacterales bacterium]